ncbi:MAG: manganese efflux pump [Deltaproteobacteria bacterium]|nr:manganese efflux pump [Deltaproteobacteria bacterium]
MTAVSSLGAATIFFIAVGLAMDAFAVSITSGLTVRPFRFGFAFKIAFLFGLFQAVMPVLGWLAGLSFRSLISGFDHWIAFGLLAFIGGKMVFEGFSDNSAAKERNFLSLWVLLVLAVATSIDALAVGLSFSLLKTSIVFPAVVIGLVTFVISALGVLIGSRFGHRFENKAEILGGLILIGIGIKIVIDHTA